MGNFFPVNACRLPTRQVSGKLGLPHRQPSYSTINAATDSRQSRGDAATASGRRPGFLWNASVKGYQGNLAGNYCNTTKDFNWYLIKPGKAQTRKGEAYIFLQYCGNFEFSQPHSFKSKSTQMVVLTWLSFWFSYFKIYPIYSLSFTKAMNRSRFLKKNK